MISYDAGCKKKPYSMIHCTNFRAHFDKVCLELLKTVRIQIKITKKFRSSRFLSFSLKQKLQLFWLILWIVHAQHYLLVKKYIWNRNNFFCMPVPVAFSNNTFFHIFLLPEIIACGLHEFFHAFVKFKKKLGNLLILVRVDTWLMWLRLGFEFPRKLCYYLRMDRWTQYLHIECSRDEYYDY